MIMDFNRAEAALLNDDGPTYEMIRDAQTYDEALQIALDFFMIDKDSGDPKLPMSNKVLTRLINKIRD